MSALQFLAFATLVAQGALFPALLIVSLRWMGRGLMTPGSPKKRMAAERIEDAPPGLPTLEPLRCSACGAGLALGPGELICAYCGAANPPPPHYVEVFALRREALWKLRDAERYLARARRLSSGGARGAILILAAWLFCVPLILLTGGARNAPYDRFVDSLGEIGGKLFGASFLTLGFWVLTLFFTGNLLTQARKTLPKIAPGDFGEAASAECPACGGAIAYRKGELATLCGYCGAETYRTAVAYQARRKASKDRLQADRQLVDARATCESVVDDLVGTPATLVFLLLVLPFLIFGLPALLWKGVEERPLPTLGVVAGAVGLGVWVARRRKKV